ncbi:uncharacterized protein LOC134203096 [Armigeres subalbatus]|uniref:uncharacterized protein LOC134203096 n=1 Tax=Armigeres subalbatus TaxID=124917 RepID=UPI002ED20BDC
MEITHHLSQKAIRKENQIRPKANARRNFRGKDDLCSGNVIANDSKPNTIASALMWKVGVLQAMTEKKPLERKLWFNEIYYRCADMLGNCQRITWQQEGFFQNFGNGLRCSCIKETTQAIYDKLEI